jgi:Dolichyl-phosphate-mannose-protein mannosyltransferase
MVIPRNSWRYIIYSSPRKWAICAIIGLMAMLSCPFLIYVILRVSYLVPISYNEGWNVFHTARLLNGEPLYLPTQDLPITPVNYPPLSFLLIGSISKFTGSILFSGRAVSLLSFLLVGYLIFKIIQSITSETLAALLGALLWLAILLGFVRHYVGMYDPQMLAHLFTLLALYFYTKWRDDLPARKIYILVLLLCFAVFTKHLLIAVPIALALTLLCVNRKACLLFILTGTSLSLVFLFSSWLYGGENFLLNFIDLDRPSSSLQLLKSIRRLFIEHFLIVLFLPFIILGVIYQKKNIFMFLYFIVSFLIGCIACRGVGVARNAWFDFFIASSILFGVFSANIENIIGRLEARPSNRCYLFIGVPMIFLGLIMSEFLLTPYVSSNDLLEASTILKIRLLQLIFILGGVILLNPGKSLTRALPSALTYGILAMVIFPLTSNLKDQVKEVINYKNLERQEEAYKNDIRLLQSIQGPALYEDLLLGFESGKKYLIDPFNSALMIYANRLPEERLLDRVREHYFTVIVLGFNIDERMRHLDDSRNSTTNVEGLIVQRWSKNTLKAIYENYELTSVGFTGAYYYRPRENQGGSTQ